MCLITAVNLALDVPYPICVLYEIVLKGKEFELPVCLCSRRFYVDYRYDLHVYGLYLSTCLKYKLDLVCS